MPQTTPEKSNAPFAPPWDRRTLGSWTKAIVPGARQRGRRVQVDVTTDAPVIGLVFDDLAPKTTLNEVAGTVVATVEPAGILTEKVLPPRQGCPRELPLVNLHREGSIA